MALVQAANQNCRTIVSPELTVLHITTSDEVSVTSLGRISLFNSSSQKKTSLRFATFKRQQLFDMDSSWTDRPGT